MWRDAYAYGVPQNSMVEGGRVGESVTRENIVKWSALGAGLHTVFSLRLLIIIKENQGI